MADHTKFGRLALARLCGLDEVDQVVVDSGLKEDDRAFLEHAGVTIHAADVVESRNNGLVLEAPRGDRLRSEE